MDVDAGKLVGPGLADDDEVGNPAFTVAQATDGPQIDGEAWARGPDPPGKPVSNGTHVGSRELADNEHLVRGGGGSWERGHEATVAARNALVNANEGDRQ